MPTEDLGDSGLLHQLMARVIQLLRLLLCRLLELATIDLAF
jgi:hypothetical protein